MAPKPFADLVDALVRVPLLAECSRKEVESLVKAGKTVSKSAGSTILEEGSKGVAFFLILDGQVDIRRGERPLARLMTGDFFGESALLSDQPRNASGVAATDVELFTLTSWAFKGILLGNAKIAYGVARSLAARVEQS